MSEDNLLDTLTQYRDEHYNGNWSYMLKVLKERIREDDVGNEEEIKLRKYIHKIQVILNIRVPQGYKYINNTEPDGSYKEFHCRVPSNLEIEDFRNAKKYLEELCEIDESGFPTKHQELYASIISTKELIYIINTYGFSRKPKYLKKPHPPIP